MTAAILPRLHRTSGTSHARQSGVVRPEVRPGDAVSRIARTMSPAPPRTAPSRANDTPPPSVHTDPTRESSLSAATIPSPHPPTPNAAASTHRMCASITSVRGHGRCIDSPTRRTRRWVSRPRRRRVPAPEVATHFRQPAGVSRIRPEPQAGQEFDSSARDRGPHHPPAVCQIETVQGQPEYRPEHPADHVSPPLGSLLPGETPFAGGLTVRFPDPGQIHVIGVPGRR
jgi:hypothetical protein